MSDLKHLSNAIRPVGCVGTPVYPGDMLDGYAVGVVAITCHFADSFQRRRTSMAKC